MIGEPNEDTKRNGLFFSDQTNVRQGEPSFRATERHVHVTEHERNQSTRSFNAAAGTSKHVMKNFPHFSLLHGSLLAHRVCEAR